MRDPKKNSYKSILFRYQSRSLFNDDRLLEEPEIVANDEKIAWATAFWFWRSSVHYSIPSELTKGYFGATTNQINGELECKGNNQKAAKIRFENYVAIMKALNLSDEPNEHGCYNQLMKIFCTFNIFTSFCLNFYIKMKRETYNPNVKFFF